MDLVVELVVAQFTSKVLRIKAVATFPATNCLSQHCLRCTHCSKHMSVIDTPAKMCIFYYKMMKMCIFWMCIYLEFLSLFESTSAPEWHNYILVSKIYIYVKRATSCIDRPTISDRHCTSAALRVAGPAILRGRTLNVVMRDDNIADWE